MILPVKATVTASTFRSVSSILIARVSDYSSDLYVIDNLQISETLDDADEPLFVGVLEMRPRNYTP